VPAASYRRSRYRVQRQIEYADTHHLPVPANLLDDAIGASSAPAARRSAF
jgi:hypothetical protein